MYEGEEGILVASTELGQEEDQNHLIATKVAAQKLEWVPEFHSFQIEFQEDANLFSGE